MQDDVGEQAARDQATNLAKYAGPLSPIHRYKGDVGHPFRFSPINHLAPVMKMANGGLTMRVAMKVEQLHPFLANPLGAKARIGELRRGNPNTREVPEGLQRLERIANRVRLQLDDQTYIPRGPAVIMRNDSKSAHYNKSYPGRVEGLDDGFEAGEFHRKDMHRAGVEPGTFGVLQIRWF